VPVTFLPASSIAEKLNFSNGLGRTFFSRGGFFTLGAFATFGVFASLGGFSALSALTVCRRS
jgi:hypothetical protein